MRQHTTRLTVALTGVMATILTTAMPPPAVVTPHPVAHTTHMLATLIVASVVVTSLGSHKLIEFDPASGNAARIVTKTSGGSRYSQWTVIQIEDLRNPAASETYSFREFSMGSGADLIHRASDKRWFRIKATVRDLGRVLEMIRVEHVVERPITISESAYRGERESQEIRHKVIHWKDGRVTDATIMIETSEEPEFEFQ